MASATSAITGARAEQRQRRRRSCRTATSSRRPSRRSAGRRCRAPARCRCRSRCADGSAACWLCAARRMSTGSTHSFFSICRMRVSRPRSAARRSPDRRGCAGRTRPDRRRCRACASPAHRGLGALVAAVVEHADHFDVGIALVGAAPRSRGSPPSPPPTMTVRRVEPALARPVPHQHRTCLALGISSAIRPTT